MSEIKESPTQFTPAKPTDVSRPDFVSQGKLIDKVLVASSGTTITSKTVQANVNINELGLKQLYVYVDHAVTMGIQLLLDESERDGSGHSVWYDYTATASPITVVAGVLYSFPTQILFKQLRITITTTVNDTTVNAWFFSTN